MKPLINTSYISFLIQEAVLRQISGLSELKEPADNSKAKRVLKDASAVVVLSNMTLIIFVTFR